jgi:DNA polymerase-3 subunit delta
VLKRHLTPAALRKQIAEKKLDSLYVVLGDDEHEKRELTNEFEETIDEGFRAFNVERFYGGEASLGLVLDSARTLPMMANKRIVILLQGERALYPKRESEVERRDLEAFEHYLETPAPDTAVVIVASSLDERRRVTKRLMTHATVVRCGEVKDISDAQGWIRTKVKASGKTIEPPAVRELASRTGPDIVRLRDEVERLLLFASNQSSIAVDDVRAISGSVALRDNWAITRAIESGNTKLALRELALGLEGGASPYMVFGQLAWVARARLPGTHVLTAMNTLFRTDLALKQSSGEPRVLLERLVIELCDKPANSGRR